MRRGQPNLTHQGGGTGGWTREQRIRTSSQLMAPLLHANMDHAELKEAATIAWAATKALEAASKRNP